MKRTNMKTKLASQVLELENGTEIHCFIAFVKGKENEGRPMDLNIRQERNRRYNGFYWCIGLILAWILAWIIGVLLLHPPVYYTPSGYK